jgi:hypothetical protein
VAVKKWPPASAKSLKKLCESWPDGYLKPLTERFVTKYTRPQEIWSKIKKGTGRNMARGKRTDLPTAALVMEMRETDGRSENEISKLTGVPAGTVHNILSRAHGWDQIAEGDVFKRHRQEQNKVLEQANRTLAKKSLEMAESKMDRASYSQLVFGAAIMTDKARLLAGEPTEIHASVNYHAIFNLDKLAAMLSQALIEKHNAIDVTPSGDNKKQD